MHAGLVTVQHPDGERLPILLDADREPIRWINEYAIQRLRPRLSANSLTKARAPWGVCRSAARS
ncbi:hypothetical protein MNJPNG_01875 [Cupriavidus oxalaticus]|uniref:hypothetical protein n=1 Tax=Cupriavidus oxalaticus TaxID=96344 RepID=UPI003F737CFF